METERGPREDEEEQEEREEERGAKEKGEGRREKKEEEEEEEERKEGEATCNDKGTEGPRSREHRKPDDKIQRKVAETPKPFRKQNVLYTYSESTRIDSLKLCETEHFLNWGNLRCFKIRPSTRTPGSALRRTVGRLRLSEPPHMTILQIRQTRIRNPMRFFCLNTLNTCLIIKNT